VLAVCCTFYVLAKSYHDHVEKQQQLEELMNNPNARVASGKKGKKVVDKIMKKTTQPEADEESIEAPHEHSIDSMIKAAKAKKVVQKKAADQEAALNAYTAPLLIQEQPVQVVQHIQPVAQPQVNYSYALIEPEQPKQVITVTPTPTQVQVPVQR
jgi:hypothetical protein